MGRSVSGIRFAAAALFFVPLIAYAAGLGRLTVLSALGQPLEVEIEIVSLQPGEEEGLSARLASPEAYRQAGIEPNPVLFGAQFSIERRAGRPVVRMRTTQPVNEPFLDVLVELQWNTGRLVREYTFLLDPPEYRGRPEMAAAPPAPEPKPAPEATPVPAAKPEPRIEARPIAPAAAPRAARAATHEVKKGETLAAIARTHLPEGVTLNQMLVALFRANRDAFVRENINLVRSGRILAVPDRSDAMSVDVTEASRLVQAHMAQFAQYRRTLAGAVAVAPLGAGAPAREASGRIAPSPQAQTPGEPKDQLRLSRVEPGKPDSPRTRAAIEDDRIAHERALKEAQARIAELERNVNELRKLLEVRDQQLAALEKKAAQLAAASAAQAPKPEPAKPEPAKAEAAKPAAEPFKAAPEPAKASPEAPKAAGEAPARSAAEAGKAPEAAKPAGETPKPAEQAAEAAKPAQAPKPVAEAKKPKPAPVKAPEPDLLDEVINFVTDPVSGGGLALVVVLLAVYGGWQWRKKKAAHARLQDSVLGAASGAPVTLATAAQPAAAAAAGAAAAAIAAVAAEQPAAAAAAEAEELDPVAEADVYMAYGRYAQAEEILKEALAKDPERLALHAKLLEVYANEKNTQAFEQTALKVKSLTGGAGPEWDKALALGHSIDPGNPLYGAAASVTAAEVAAPAAAPTLDFDLGIGPEASAPAQAQTADVTGPLDLDLGAAPELEGARADAAVPLDFDLGAVPEKSDFAPDGTLVLDAGEAKAAFGGLDFELGATPAPQAEAGAPKPAADAEATVALDFDLNLDLGEPKAEAKPAAAEAPLDLGAIDLDLGAPYAPAAGGDEEKWRTMTEKLELSKAFLDIGQKDEARELLNEVMKEGDASQREQARQMLAGLG